MTSHDAMMQKMWESILFGVKRKEWKEPWKRKKKRSCLKKHHCPGVDTIMPLLILG